MLSKDSVLKLFPISVKQDITGEGESEGMHLETPQGKGPNLLLPLGDTGVTKTLESLESQGRESGFGPTNNVQECSLLALSHMRPDTASPSFHLYSISLSWVPFL